MASRGTFLRLASRSAPGLAGSCVVAALACSRSATSSLDADDSGATSAAASATSVLVVAPSAAAPPPPPASASASAPPRPTPAALVSVDGSASSCRVLRGPIELPVRGPATLVARANTIDAVLDDAGRPQVASFAAGPFVPPSSSPPPRELADASTPVVPRAPRVPCAVADEVAFCPDPTGAVHRAQLTGDGDRIVASARTGTRVAASAFAGTHTALAYLASRKTSEGWVSEAWLTVDDDLPVRLSEDGSGATAVDLAPSGARGASLLALSVDARTALTALHARPVTYDHGAHLGEDVVLFVGGPGDRRTAAVLALATEGPSWALLPIARDTEEFGLATVRIDVPPHVDEPVVWSMYPNGLDPASVASAVASGHTWVARIRPQDAAVHAARVLELGDVSPEGVFAPRAVLPTGEAPADLSVALDGHGALWLAWVDADGSWLERLVCR
jgi:hypothetical protein